MREHTRTLTHTHTHIHTYTHTHTHKLIHIHTLTHKHTNAKTHSQNIRADTHTHTHTHYLSQYISLSLTYTNTLYLSSFSLSITHTCVFVHPWEKIIFWSLKVKKNKNYFFSSNVKENIFKGKRGGVTYFISNRLFLYWFTSPNAVLKIIPSHYIRVYAHVFGRITFSDEKRLSRYN